MCYPYCRIQGIEGEDFEAVIDLGLVLSLNTVSLSFLQRIISWIFPPSEVTVFISEDGKDYKRVETIRHPEPADYLKDEILQFSILLHEKKARLIKISAKNIGHCPEWHQGAGGKAWLFADEIIIE